MSAPRCFLRTSSPSSSSSSNALMIRRTGRRSRSFFAHAIKTVTVAQNNSTPSSKASKPLTTLPEANSRNLPDLWFSPTFPYGNGIPPLGQGPDKPPDGRKAKLGKSEFPQSLCNNPIHTHTHTYTRTHVAEELTAPSSAAHPPRTPPHPPPVTAPAGDPRAQHQPPPLPLDPPAPPDRIRPRRLHDRAVVLADRVEPPAHHRRRAARDPVGAHAQGTGQAPGRRRRAARCSVAHGDWWELPHRLAAAVP